MNCRTIHGNYEHYRFLETPYEFGVKGNLKVKIFFAMLFLFLFSVSYAQKVSHKKKYSVLGESKNEIYEQFNDYDKFQNIIERQPSGTIISTPTIAAKDFEEPLPESVQEIAGNELLDYLDDGLFSNMGYSRDKW
ncbi:MAG: hypothetical protein LBO62_03315, partial [Endomicrobium sp.]|nr:hypothetical protein [Endomicrobium sp.]